MLTIKRATVGLVGVVAAVLIVAAQVRADGRQVYREAVRGTALVIAGDSAGTGFLIDRERRLLLTAHHVVTDSDNGRVTDEVRVVFPAFEDGRPVAEKAYYKERLATLSVRGKVFDTDPERDLAVIVLESVPEGAAALKLAAESPWPGDVVHAVGNPGKSDALWVYNTGAVRQVYKFDRVIGLQHVAARVIETQSPLNPGDSGGPLFNDAGEVVGVHCCIKQDTQLIGESIDLSEVKAFLAEEQPLLAARSASQLADRAERYAAKGRAALAVADLDAAVKAQPKSVAMLLRRARLSNDLRRHQQALADGNTALLMAPKNAAAFVERARAYTGLGNAEAALADAAEAVKIDESLTAAYVQKAAAERALGQLPLALADLDEAVKRGPEYVPAYKGRAALYVQLGRLDEAAADLDEAVRLTPKDADGYLRRAAVRVEQGEAEAALRDVDRALALDRTLGEGHELRGDVLAAAGEYDAALRSYKTAFLLGGGDKVTTERLLKKAAETAAKRDKDQ